MFIPSLFTLLTYLYYKKNIRKCQIIQSCGNEMKYSSLKKIINIEIAQWKSSDKVKDVVCLFSVLSFNSESCVSSNSALWLERLFHSELINLRKLGMGWGDTMRNRIGRGKLTTSN